jgi:TldD protein
VKRFSVALLLALPLLAADAKDPILRAIEDEMARSGALGTVAPAQPYFFEYAIHDGALVSISSTLGAVVTSRSVRFRFPQVGIRVGDYQFDDTNYAGGDYHAGASYDVFDLPLEDSYAVLRHHLWLATDMAYKQALELLSLKRAALRDVTPTEDLPDFSRAARFERIAAGRIQAFDAAAWEARLRRLSALFASYPALRQTGVSFEGARGVFYLANSEGTRIRVPETSAGLRVRANAQAPDGMLLHDAVSFQSLDPDRMPPDAEIERGVKEVAENLTALVGAPVGESYSGPVLFEGVASAQLFAQVLGANCTVPRRPITPPGRSSPLAMGEFENRIGSRVLPEWMDVVDDPTQSEWHGRALFGHYDVDLEGVAAQSVSLVEKGVLKNFLLTRQPVKTFRASNGHARLPGSFGAKAAGIGNLFVSASGGVSQGALRQRLIDLCRERGKPYGILIRKLDFPTTASSDELRRAFAGMQSGARPVSPPILIYRVYPDGREQLVRGLRLRGLDVRSLKDIVAASSETTTFDFYNTGAPLAMEGASFRAESSVVAPSVLIDDVEIERIEGELPKLPVVPAPPAGTLKDGPS